VSRSTGEDFIIQGVHLASGLRLDSYLGPAVGYVYDLVFVNEDLFESLNDLRLSRVPIWKYLLIFGNNGLRDGGRDFHETLNLVTGDLEDVFGGYALHLG